MTQPEYLVLAGEARGTYLSLALVIGASTSRLARAGSLSRSGSISTGTSLGLQSARSENDDFDEVRSTNRRPGTSGSSPSL
jgi:hypothetical protein